MRKWGRGSQRVWSTVCPELKEVFDIVLEMRDLSAIDGHRDEATQNHYFETGVSKAKWGESLHNHWPSAAVDVQPYPYVEETLREDLTYIAGLVIAVGYMLDYDIRWGGDWDEDGETADNSFDDLFHFELRRRRGRTNSDAGDL